MLESTGTNFDLRQYSEVLFMSTFLNCHFKFSQLLVLTTFAGNEWMQNLEKCCAELIVPKKKSTYKNDTLGVR
jgi:hypothetical protein